MSRSENKFLTVAVFSAFALLTIVLNIFCTRLGIAFLRTAVIVNYLLLIPFSVWSLRRSYGKTALLFVILYLFPVPGRFFLPQSILVKIDQGTLYSVARKLERFTYEHKRAPESWKEMKNVKSIKRTPYSLVNFKYFELNRTFDGNCLIIIPPFKYKGERILIYYDSKESAIKYAKENG